MAYSSDTVDSVVKASMNAILNARYFISTLVDTIEETRQAISYVGNRGLMDE
jgi:hypothetical protein